MPLANSGTISLSQIQTEFGGANPISMSEYYTNAVSGFTTGIIGLPASGTTVSLSVFRGKAKTSISTEIVVAGTTSTTIGTTDRCIVFPYSGTGTTKDYTFTTTEPLIFDILMIGGGGAGGYDRAGGGGAGSCIIAVSQTLGAGTYNIKVGKGQTAYNNYQGQPAGFGYDSEIYLNTSILYRAKGGGMGGSGADNNANVGGCGGGAASQGPFNGGSATNLNYIAGNLVNANTITTTYANLGFKGGAQFVPYDGNNLNYLDGAGGGGIGAAGVDHNIGDINGKAGGAGLNQVSINGTPYNFQSYFANGGTFGDNGYIGGGGGGGNLAAGVNGNGGVGGGGSGGGSSALANTGGGGGGGAAGGGMGGNGGSGIVIARYRKLSIPTEIVVAGTTSIIIGATDRYISFPYSGTAATKDYTFTTTENLICDILVVGGGGGGGKRGGGGGGAGACLYHKNVNLNAGTFTVGVGKGGLYGGTTGTSWTTIPASPGGDSTLIYNSTTKYRAKGGGGGQGGDGDVNSNTSGGSSGGGNWVGIADGLSTNNIFDGSTVSIVSNQYVNTLTSPEGCRGNVGGNQLSNYKGGGGGGAGSAGMNHDPEATTNDGYGGLGLSIDITGASVVYAGGGNGSDYMAGHGIEPGDQTQSFNPAYPTIQSRGGGGYGSDNGTAQNGLDGTGGGGGGQGSDSSTTLAGSGGSGIVIIRYRRYHPYLLNNYAPLTAGVAVPYSDLCTTIVSSTGQTAYDNLPVVSYGGYNWLLQHNFGTTGRWSGLQLRNFTTGLTIFSNAQLTSQNYTSFPSATSQIYTDWAPGWSYGSAYGIGGFNNTTNNGPNNIYSNYNTLFQPYFTSLGYSSMSNPSTSSSMIMYIPSWAKQVCLVAADLFRENNAGSNTRKNSYWWSANGTTWTNLGIASWRGSINGGDQYGSNISQDPSSNADMMVFNVSTAGYLLILESGNTITSIAFVLLKP
jgi:hypothetical protein